VKYLWMLIGLAYGVLNIYVGYVLVVAGSGPKLAQKGILAVLALPLIWNSLRFLTAKTPPTA
jgi:membrane glycosyltransferase